MALSCSLKIRRERIVIPVLAENLDGYKVLHVSDIHFDRKVGANRVLWEKLHDGSADLILITGDFITHERNIDSLLEYLDGTRANDGVYAILGNHDYRYLTLWQHFRHEILGREYQVNEWQKLVACLGRLGIRVLVNEQVLVRTSTGARIFLEGTDDPVLGSPEISPTSSDYDTSDLKILMSHSPDILYSKELEKKRFDVILSGHTHGGQIRLPGIGPLLTGTDRASRREAYGLFDAKDGTRVNVTAGVGHSLLPIRINCEAEIVLIEFSRTP